MSYLEIILDEGMIRIFFSLSSKYFLPLRFVLYLLFLIEERLGVMEER